MNFRNYKALFDQSPLVHIVIGVSDDQKTYSITDINPAACAYFKVMVNDAIGLPIQDVLRKEIADHLHQSLRTCTRTRSPVTIQNLPGFPENRIVHAFILTPITDDEDNLTHIHLMSRPEAHEDAQILRERDDALSLLTSLFDTSDVGIVISDRKRHIVRVNDAFIRSYGWGETELIGEDFSKLLPKAAREEAQKNHDDFIAAGEQSTMELDIMCKDGDMRSVLMSSSLLELSQKRRFRVATLVDITDRKAMEISLREAKDQADSANYAKSLFLANMSHELRTPLNAIIGFSEVMINAIYGPVGHEKYEEYLADVKFSAEHLLSIITDVLDMSKIEAGKVKPVDEPVGVPNLIDSIIRLLQGRVLDSDVKLVTDIEKDLPGLMADSRLLRQILINLIGNAIKFSDKGDTIDIKVSMVDTGCMRFVVRDEGIGIPKDKLEVVLEPFGQAVNSSHQNQRQGTGLGLPLARAMIEMHGGTMQLESEEGKGTAVSFEFPADRIIKPE